MWGESGKEEVTKTHAGAVVNAAVVWWNRQISGSLAQTSPRISAAAGARPICHYLLFVRNLQQSPGFEKKKTNKKYLLSNLQGTCTNARLLERGERGEQVLILHGCGGELKKVVE